VDWQSCREADSRATTVAKETVSRAVNSIEVSVPHQRVRGGTGQQFLPQWYRHGACVLVIETRRYLKGTAGSGYYVEPPTT
jgi:hypothetical protein